MDECTEMACDAEPVIADVSRALRTARQRLAMSQREFADEVGVSKSCLARLEIDAGHQSLDAVSSVLKRSGFRFAVVDTVGAELDGPDAFAATALDLSDASGRRFPAHLAVYPLAYPPLYWFVRNGGWLTKKAFPQWTFERRYVPRTPGRRGALVGCDPGGARSVLVGEVGGEILCQQLADLGCVESRTLAQVVATDEQVERVGKI
jgi:transcriptional regulator with XRE-family HTH domain